MKIARSAPRAGAGWPRAPRRDHPLPPALEWAEDVTGRCARVTAVGGHSLLVENHTGLLGFTEKSIRLDTRGGPLCVLGDGLSLRDVRPGALVIHGRIRRVELPCRGGEAPDAR